MDVPVCPHIIRRGSCSPYPKMGSVLFLRRLQEILLPTSSSSSSSVRVTPITLRLTQTQSCSASVAL
eukprot:7583325-Pyramimonas_sp.AAC.1